MLFRSLELLNQHERETGQLFDPSVKAKISEITANQPGLVNAFAAQLVADYPQKAVIEYDDYLKVEDWFLTEAMDKNISNIINKAEEHRTFVEQLLFKDVKVRFQINDVRAKHSCDLVAAGHAAARRVGERDVAEPLVLARTGGRSGYRNERSRTLKRDRVGKFHRRLSSTCMAGHADQIGRASCRERV